MYTELSDTRSLRIRPLRGLSLVIVGLLGRRSDPAMLGCSARGLVAVRGATLRDGGREVVPYGPAGERNTLCDLVDWSALARQGKDVGLAGVSGESPTPIASAASSGSTYRPSFAMFRTTSARVGDDTVFGRKLRTPEASADFK